jgi:hypothetical protein
MRVIGGRHGWWAAGLLALVSPTAAACGDGCGDMSCGSGVLVWWAPGDLPEADAYRLCIDDACGDGCGDVVSVVPAAASGGSEVAVRLELLDEEGRVTGVFPGAGTKSGECCRGIELRVDGERRLVAEGVLDRRP